MTCSIKDNSFGGWIGVQNKPVRALCAVETGRSVGYHIAEVSYSTSDVHAQNIKSCV